MVTANTHLAALLALLLGAAQTDAHRYRAQHHHHGRRLFKPAFEMATVEAFRPFHTPPAGSGLFTSGGPLVDVFQEVMGDVKRGEPLEIAFTLLRIVYITSYVYIHSSNVDSRSNTIPSRSTIYLLLFPGPVTVLAGLAGYID